MVNFGLRVARGHGLSVSHASIPSRKNTLCFRGRFGDSLPVVRAARTFATSADSDTEVGVVGSENVGGLEGGLEGVDGVDGVDGARTSFDSTLGFQSVDFALEDDDALAPVEDDSDVETEDEVLSSSFASLFTDGEASDADEVVDENLLVRNCGLNEETVAILVSRGI